MHVGALDLKFGDGLLVHSLLVSLYVFICLHGIRVIRELLPSRMVQLLTVEAAGLVADSAGPRRVWVSKQFQGLKIGCEHYCSHTFTKNSSTGAAIFAAIFASQLRRWNHWRVTDLAAVPRELEQLYSKNPATYSPVLSFSNWPPPVVKLQAAVGRLGLVIRLNYSPIFWLF